MPQKHQYTSPRGITLFLKILINLKNIQRGKLHEIIKTHKIVFRGSACAGLCFRVLAAKFTYRIGLNFITLKTL